MSHWLTVRRSADIVCAGLGLVVLWPVLVLLAIMVMAGDGGVPFVRLVRVGRNGAPFGMWKIRSMSTGSEGQSSITAGSDQRVTRIGSLMRRFRLDEIPQLLHVVTGDMSLIGPRPEDPGFVDMNEPLWKQVLQCRPGIAGVTQVVIGPWEAELPETDTQERYAKELLPTKLEIDAWYVRNASPATDAVVCWSLITGCLGSRRSTAAHRLIRKHLPALPARFEFAPDGLGAATTAGL